MMNQRAWPDIFLTLRSSRVLFIYLFSCHLLVILPLPWLGLPAIASIVLLLAVSISAWSTLRFHALRRDKLAICALHWCSDGRLLVTQAGGQCSQVIIQGDVFVHPRLLVIGLKGLRRWPVYLVICPDMCAPENFRRLRVRLRFGYILTG